MTTSYFKRQLGIYSSYHTDYRNRATHFIGIPAILFSVPAVLALWRFPVFGLNVSVDGSWELNPDSDIVVSLEEDVTWIQAPGGPVPFDVLDLERQNEKQLQADARALRQLLNYPGRPVVRG